ncbi:MULTISPECIES: ABC transporter substrate-binding protein [unclassified Azospirillum]|uniref:substrate-binding periplasmic protein n=1 Tax=unclassified Azospirillum TaxID=2630922 RepID=UPI000B76575A|nr:MULTISPECIES: transporter substrate-binding domain-containing protein [unclassified Azospirillum]SNS87530.1 amino acid ABC transporter substrate-binding protein, PAAT family [Azospirillum sp. RU38E]SNT04466.1 amino acid ABC transporter substrate-binding protein, PAAT family [Azospirillum sp. RU37A]
MNRRHLLTLITTLPLAAGFSRSSPAAPLDKVMAKGVLRIAVYRDNPPWSWRAEGRLVGIDVDIGRALAEKLGLKAEFMELTADENMDDDLRNAVWKGSILGEPVADIMMHVPHDREFGLRNDMAVLTAPYHRESFALACNPARTECRGNLVEMAGSAVAVETDSVPDFYLTGAFGGRLRGDVVHHLTPAAALADLTEGNAGAAMATLAQVEQGLAGKAKGLVIRRGPFPGLLKQAWEIGLAVKTDSRDLGYRLEDIMAGLLADGRIAGIFATHGISHVPPGV